MLLQTSTSNEIKIMTYSCLVLALLHRRHNTFSVLHVIYIFRTRLYVRYTYINILLSDTERLIYCILCVKLFPHSFLAVTMHADISDILLLDFSVR